MKRKNEKINGKVAAVILAVLMAFGMAAGTRALLERPFATEIGKFDPAFYAQTYPDVAAVLGTDAEVLYSHYQNFGQKEGRIPYAGAVAGEVVDGIVGMDVTVQTTVRTPAAVVPQTLYSLDGRLMGAEEQIQKQQAFDASGYVKVGWTEEQVQAKLLSLKEVYPDGTKVGICSIGAAKIQNSLYGEILSAVIGINDDGDWVYPNGYVRFASKLKKEVNIKDILRVGDTVYTRGEGTGHVQIVMSHDEQGITVVESNFNGDKAVHWGRRITWSDLEGNGKNEWYMIEHYLY